MYNTTETEEGAWFYRRVGKTGKGAFGLGFEGCVRVCSWVRRTGQGRGSWRGENRILERDFSKPAPPSLHFEQLISKRRCMLSIPGCKAERQMACCLEALSQPGPWGHATVWAGTLLTCQALCFLALVIGRTTSFKHIRVQGGGGHLGWGR